jgi:O-antigen/teichoic acid export membrane protein
MLGHEIVGFYSVALHLASLPSQKIAGLVNGVAFPAFSSKQQDLRWVRDNVLLGLRILSFFAFPVSWGMSSIAPEIVDVILGSKWALSTIPLQVLTLIVPLRMSLGFVSIAVQGIGRSDIPLRNTVWAVVVGPPILLAGAYSGGLVGLCLAWLVVTPTLSVAFVLRSAPVVGLRPTQIFAALMPAAGAALVMYAAVALARHVLGPTQGGVLHLCLLVAAGALAYGVVSFGANWKGTREVLEIVRSIATTKREWSTNA